MTPVQSPFATFIVVSDGPGAARDRLLASLETHDVDVQLVQAGDGLAIAINSAAAGAATEFVAIVHPVGTVAASAVALVRDHFSANPSTGVYYADETRPVRRKRVSISKPSFSPERLRCQNYLGEVVFYRRDLFVATGGVNPALPGAELYDLALRCTRATDSVVHLDLDLFAHDAPSAPLLDAVALASTESALSAHLAVTGGGVVRSVGADGVHDTRRPVVGTPLVSIIIPTRGVHTDIDGATRCFVIDAVRSIVDVSTWVDYEIVLVIDSVAEQSVVEELVSIGGERVRFVEWDKPFNFSEKINLGAINGRGEFVLLLNDDVKVITPDWIESLLALAQLPGAGMSGCMLYYADETIQHAGHHYFLGDVSHIGLDSPRGDPGPINGFRVEREVAGVTAACAMMPKSVFLEVGGLTNLLPGNFNDVDLCLKTVWQEHPIYWTPHAELYHFESKTRDASVHAFEIDVAWRRWGFMVEDSPLWPYPFSRPPT